jgi:ornithine cyclodeaminase/alanine dehydrogenase-like protein (mu-crystallin family)
VTRFLGPDELDRHLTPAIALRAMGEAFALEGEHATQLPPRIDTPSPRGFLRVMPAVLDNVMGLKVMSLAEEVGTRYLVLLYDVDSGALLAIFDADEMTRARTAATTALAASHLRPDSPHRLGVIGSGFEAVGEVRALAAIWPLDDVVVFSPNAERRARFAASMTSELAVTVRAVDSCDAAVKGQDVVVLATKASKPVIDGAHLARGCTVLSIGSTRPDLRELDRATLARAGTVVGDDPLQLELESGDIIDALQAGVLDRDRMVRLAALCNHSAAVRVDDAHDLLVFKSVGTALQDLAIARAAFRNAVANGHGVELGELARLKPFADRA